MEAGGVARLRGARWYRAEMYWRFVHRFLGWMFPAVGAAYGGALGIAASAASQNLQAKRFLDDQIALLQNVTSSGLFLILVVLVIAGWLVAFLYTGQKAEAYSQAQAESQARAARPVPVAVQPRIKAQSPRRRAADRKRRVGKALGSLIDEDGVLGAIERKRQAKERPYQLTDQALAGLERIAQGITDVPAYGATENVGQEKSVPAPKRDKRASEALAFAVFGEWGEKFSSVPTHLSDWNSVNPPMEQFREAALNRQLTVWGKPGASLIFEEIPWTYWRDHGLELHSLLMGRALTTPLMEVEHTLVFSDVMVSQFEVERVWPHAG